MTSDDIIRMAREAGMGGMLTDVVCSMAELERFAALVAEHEREACDHVVDASQPLGRIAETSAAIRARGNETGKATP